jgi:hypothetical protein
MSEDGSNHIIVRRLIDCLNYVLDKDDSDEIAVEITFKGAMW